MPLSAFTADRAIDIFDQPVLESLAQGPRVGGHRQGLELTQPRLKTSVILAEAFMFAMTHPAMFHVAAVEHFVDRDDLEMASVRQTSAGSRSVVRGPGTLTRTPPSGCGPTDQTARRRPGRANY